MAKYSKKTQDTVERAMHKKKHGELKSGKGGKGGKVKSRKQAIAIGLSEAREKGYKAPKKKTSSKSSSSHKRKAGKPGPKKGSHRSS